MRFKTRFTTPQLLVPRRLLVTDHCEHPGEVMNGQETHCLRLVVDGVPHGVVLDLLGSEWTDESTMAACNYDREDQRMRVTLLGPKPDKMREKAKGRALCFF